ncbi:hypothetical protein D5P86_00420 [Salmonella enterica subsp. enterica serovar Infantis]|nr:hypothetical protein [Salmonella enterica subsp. enterica serovar Infantis]
MPITSRPKTEDKFSRARAAKNSPERQEAAKKKGPVTMKRAAPVEERPKVRDEDRVHKLVHTILSAWKAERGRAENTAFTSGIVKVSRLQIEGALRDLKNTRFTKIPTLINDILTGTDICSEFGQWVYVEHDAPDWIFVRLPDNDTPVLRVSFDVDSTGQTSPAIPTSSEALLASYCEEDVEDKGPDMDAIRKTLVARSNYTAEYVARMSDKDVLAMNAFYAL